MNFIRIGFLKKILEIINSSEESSVNTNLIKSYVKIIRTVIYKCTPCNFKLKTTVILLPFTKLEGLSLFATSTLVLYFRVRHRPCVI
jgi:hypothetical protein